MATRWLLFNDGTYQGLDESTPVARMDWLYPRPVMLVAEHKARVAELEEAIREHLRAEYECEEPHEAIETWTADAPVYRLAQVLLAAGEGSN
jgi:hypothetical protein